MNPWLRLQRWTIAIGLSLIGVFIAASVYDAWRLYEQVTESAERELANLARALSEEAERSLQAVDLLLTDTALWYQGSGRQMPEPAIQMALASRANATPYVSVLTLVDASGWQRYRSRATGEPLADVSDRPYFTAQRDQAHEGLYINPPIVTRSQKRAALVVSRRLEREDGSFDGVVSASVALDDLREVYDAIHLGPYSALVLTFDDGRLVVRHPEHAQAPFDARFPEIAAQKDKPASRRRSPVDGRDKFIVATSVSERPLILAVSRDAEDVLRPWRYDITSIAVRAVLVTLVGLATMGLLIRQLRRLDAAEAERAQLEAQLRQAQHLEALGTLAGGIAHDFNNILGAILGHGEMAQRDAPEGSPLRRHIDRVMQGGERARLLVRRILDFSRSSLRERVRVPLQPAVEEALALLAPNLPPQVQLETALAGAGAAIQGDPTQIHQLVANLCTNAVGAMLPQGGRLGVTLERSLLRQGCRLSHGQVEAGAWACLAVSDSGTGITPEVLVRMFDPFFSTKRVGEGTGLGLSVVHSIVADLGGAIDVQTTAGRGSRFALWLPLADDGDAADIAARDSACETPPQGRGQVVMVVDDEAALLEATEDMLAQLGYEPVGFASAAAALAQFEADPQRWDALLSDESMPELAGTELAARARALRPELPVIIVSGYGGDQLE
ncbi:ATP-binding protein, partial [Pelomonas sp. KK5]|uniref:ATP-binding protein n=1 Tax=Pelomonas sp. KK5 TaxID=1855730 RepID=UPI00117F5818